LDHPLPERGAYRWQRDAARIRVYHQLGEQDKLREVLRGVQQYDRLNQNETAAAVDLVEQLVLLRLEDEAQPVAAALLASGVAPAEVFGKLTPKTPLAAEVWWRFLRLQNPGKPHRETIARTPALCDSRLNSADGKAL